MAVRKSTRVNRKYKTKYRVTNWREYERGLQSRGDITVWFSDEASDAWTPPKNGRRGGQPRYSNLAIVTALTLRMVFHLPLRQTEGVLDSLLRLMELDLKSRVDNGGSCMSAWMTTASSWRRSSRRAARTIRPLSRVCSSARTGRLSDPTFHSRWGLRYSVSVRAAR